MQLLAASLTQSASVVLFKLNVTFPSSPSDFEQIILRWVHISAGIVWLGILSFFVLAGAPMLKTLDKVTRAKVFPEMASRGLWWLRWSAVVSWLAGFRYFMILAKTDAINAGRPHAWGGWLGIWFGCWLAAFAIEMALIRGSGGSGPLGNKYVNGVLVLFIITATSWLVVSLLAQAGVGNRTLSIAIGGGLGTILFFNIWGIAWRCQKRLIGWTRAFSESGTPMPPEAGKMADMAMLTMEINFWLSIPMLFFMASSAHFPFLSGV